MTDGMEWVGSGFETGALQRLGRGHAPAWSESVASGRERSDPLCFAAMFP